MTAPTPATITAARQAAGLSTAQAAALIGAGEASTWRSWELGRRSMHPAAWQLFRRRIRQCAASSIDAVIARASALQPPTPDEIRDARHRAGLSQTQAAALVHAALSSWAKWESVSGDANHRQMPAWTWALFRLQLGIGD
jgi:DNA (cytosine-5)-methyltransferase 1